MTSSGAEIEMSLSVLQLAILPCALILTISASRLLTNFMPTLCTSTESGGDKETRIKSETVTTKLGGEAYSPARPPATPPPDASPCVKVKDISASWSYEREKLVLSNISMEVKKVS